MTSMHRRPAGVALVAVALACATAASDGSAIAELPAALCGTAAAGPATGDGYYAIDLVPTRRVPGTGGARGTARVTFARSPFGVAVSAGGSYAQALDIRVEGLRPRASFAFVAWAATSDLEKVTRIGVLDAEAQGHLAARVEWNKFLVIITAEPSSAAAEGRWQGPIVMRGMSRSGMMHTMAGHGPFEVEPCLKYGYR